MTTRRRLLVLWKSELATVLGDQGPERLGREMVRGALAPDAPADRLALATDSEYYWRAVAAAAAVSRERAGSAAELAYPVALLEWAGWPLPIYRREFAVTVLHPAAAEMPVRNKLLQMARVDTRLGDPRLPRNRSNWVEQAQARDRVQAWLSQFDIVFFFDHVLGKGNDPHGRKAFWLQYVSRLRASRPALSPDDRRRLRRSLEDKLAPDSAGLDSALTSAFILDFGAIVAVEFSAVGNALYMYARDEAREVVPDLWVPGFRLSILKDRPRAVSGGEVVVHRVGWQEEAGMVLARYGIRP